MRFHAQLTLTGKHVDILYVTEQMHIQPDFFREHSQSGDGMYTWGIENELDGVFSVEDVIWTLIERIQKSADQMPKLAEMLHSSWCFHITFELTQSRNAMDPMCAGTKDESFPPIFVGTPTISVLQRLNAALQIDGIIHIQHE